MQRKSNILPLSLLQRFHSRCIPKPPLQSGIFLKKMPPSADPTGHTNCGTALDFAPSHLSRRRHGRNFPVRAGVSTRYRNQWKDMNPEQGELCATHICRSRLD